ncbi:MAG: UvrD-helicase domain-containing protein [Bacilli bacterium]|nr:UvrD-helicase domain-containing protein [Bacilli bacterium]
MQKNQETEEQYLELTLKKLQEQIIETNLKLQRIPSMYKNERLIENLTKQYASKLIFLKKTEDKPYFARIDFKNINDSKEEELYIGKTNITDEDNNIITIDWRAPISSLYYDSNIGHASYKAPEGIIKGELLLKRQYEIDNRKLISFQDVDTVSNDEILKPYLGVNANNRLKNIIATIQSEQNEIIREPLHENIIVQGVAGSGKTTVALHRIAYLVYNNIDNINPEEYLVIGPNKFFVNYISGVLPDLDVNNVYQLTYEEIVKDLIKENFILLSDESKIKKSINNHDKLSYQKYKNTLIFKDIIDKYLIDYNNNIIPNNDFIIKGIRIIPHNIITNTYNSIEKNTSLDYDILTKKIDKTCLLLEKYISDNKDRIILNTHNIISNINLEQKRKDLKYIEKELKNNCKTSLKKYFSKSKPKILKLYLDLLENLNKYINPILYNTIKEDITINIKNIKSKKVEFEDLAPILYLYYRIYGSSNYSIYRHTVIDEAQDFGELNFYTLKKLMPKSTFSIFGDLAQEIYQYRSIDNWNQVMEHTFNNDCTIKYLKKSYRTTTEIMEEANNIIKHLNLPLSEPVIRHGEEVKYIQVTNNIIETIINILNIYKQKEYNSIAIITKDEEESNNLYSKLKDYNLNITNITNYDTYYQGGICIITSYLSKGLEFDGVIITNASSNIYNKDSIIDMKLLYVSMTRSLHELTILYTNSITKPLINN